MTVFLDGAAVRTPEALHAAVARQLSLPDWYGSNLDALFDALTDLGGPVEFELKDLTALRTALGDYFNRFLRVLADAGQQGPESICLRLAPEELLAAQEQEEN